MGSAVTPITGYQRPKVEVYNPTDFVKFPTFNGRCFNNRAQGGVAPESVFLVEDSLDYARDPDKNHLLTNLPRRIAGDGSLDAHYIAGWLTQSPDCPHAKDDCFVVLHGTPEEKERQKAEARRRWEEQYIGVVQNRILQWERFVGGFGQGEMPPMQPKQIRDDYKWRAKHRARFAQRAEYICRVCSYESDGWDEMKAHVSGDHPTTTLQAAVVSMKSPDLPEVTPDERPSARIGAGLIEACKASEFELNKAEIKALEFGDEDIIADVRERLTAARQAEKEKAARRQKAREKQNATADQASEGGADVGR